MTQSIMDAVAQGGAFAALLSAVLYWLARHYLPEQERQHRQTLERIVSAHENALAGLSAALDRNTRTLALNSQALLAQALSRSGRSGLSRTEVEGLLQQLSQQLAPEDLPPEATQPQALVSA